MGLFDQFPYTNFHELNLDWLLNMVKELNNTVENFVSLNTIKYANPIQWDISTQYETNTVVIDPNDGTAYLSVKPVPTGVSITNTDYWTAIFTLNLGGLADNLTLRDDGSNVLATFTSAIGDWLLWNNELYKVTSAINLNEAYAPGVNITRYTVEMYINDVYTEITTVLNSINATIGDLANLSTADRSSIVNAVNELVTLIGDLADLPTTDKSSIVNSLIEEDATLRSLIASNQQFVTPQQFGAVGDGSTDDTQAFVDALASGESIIYIPAGHYKITSTITLPRFVRIMGSSWKSAIIEAWNCSAFNIEPTWGCTIEHLMLRSRDNDGNLYPKVDKGIICNGTSAANAVNECTFNDLYILGFNVGIDLRYTWNSKLNNIFSTLCNINVQVWGQSVNNSIINSSLTAVSNTNTIGDSSGSASVHIWPSTDPTDYMPEGISIVNSMLTSGRYGIFCGECLALEVSNSFVDLVTDIGIRLGGYNPIINGNWINADNRGIYATNRGAAANLNAVITNNTILTDLAGSQGVRIGYYNDNCIVSNNYIRCKSSGVYSDAYNKNINISNNIIEHDTGTSPSSIYFGSSRNIATNNKSNTTGLIVQNAVAPNYISGNDSIMDDYTYNDKPTSGTWSVGDKVLFHNVFSTGYIGAVCTVAGTPGTWKYFGALQT